MAAQDQRSGFVVRYVLTKSQQVEGVTSILHVLQLTHSLGKPPIQDGATGCPHMGKSQPESTAVQAELAVRGVLMPGKVLWRGPRLHTPVGGPNDLNRFC